MKEIFMVKGASASGKSTRYLYLIRFLKSLDLKFTEYIYTSDNGKSEKFGLICEDLNLFFLGRISEKTGLWRGMDDSLDIIGNVNNLFSFIKEKSEKYSFCIEGSSIVRSYRFRPLYLRNEIGFDFVFIQYYNFKNKQDFIDRKFIRSKKIGENGWDCNESFINDYYKSLDESKKFNDDSVIVVENNFDSPVYDIGVKVLNQIGGEFLINKYIDFCNSNFKIN